MVRYVVMGAGQASRMGQDKLAMPWEETTILGHIIYTIMKTLNLLETQKMTERILRLTENAEEGYLLNLSCDYEIFVIARKSMSAYMPTEELNTPKVQLNWIQLLSPQPLAETIRAGLSGLSEETRGICFIPGDQVGLRPKILAELTTAYLRNTPDFLVPQAEGTEGTTGSPVFFNPRYLEELRALEGDRGGKAVLAKYPDQWMTYPVPKEFLWDVDTWEEYEAYQKGR